MLQIFGSEPIIVGLGQDPKLVIGIIIVVLVVQQIDGNILTPKVQGKGLNLHPLSILITIAIFGNGEINNVNL